VGAKVAEDKISHARALSDELRPVRSAQCQMPPCCRYRVNSIVARRHSHRGGHPRRFLRRIRPKRSPRPTFPNARRKWEPSPIPSSTPEQLAAPEPELPIERAEPEVSINDHPVNENVRRFRYHFSVTVRTVYDDNINLRTVHPSSDFYTSFEPTVRLSLGEPGTESNNILQFIYAPNVVFFYDLSSKTFLNGGVDYSRNDYANLISSEALSGNLFLNYNYSPKLVVGLGGTFGYNQTDGATPAQTFEQVNLRASFNPGEKLSLSGSVGFEFRQFEGDTRGTYISPVFQLTASYKPFDGTSISVDGSRRTQNSAVIQRRRL